MIFNIALIGSFVLSLLIAWLLGYIIIPILHKLKFGQTILVDIGPTWHKNKQGIPTMGGFMFIISILLSSIFTLVIMKATGNSAFSSFDALKNTEYMKVFGGMIMAVMFASIGFADDFIKVAKHRNLGLTEIQKTIPQILVSVVYLAGLYKANGGGFMRLPFVDSPVDIKLFYWIFGVCVIYGTVNAVNFTDGIDGLCASVTDVTALSFVIAAILYKFSAIGVLGSAVAGGCVGYYIWNKHPAKVMMGDTGSMFLGGIVVALAYGIDMPVILIPFGLIYVIEALSDVIQILSVKLRHKRVFIMTPIHHHFEKTGWKEVKIVRVFTCIQILASILGLLLIYFGDNRVM